MGWNTFICINSYSSVFAEMDDVNVEIDEGMTAICDFEVGKRTIIEYFLEPVTEGLKNSFQEK